MPEIIGKQDKNWSKWGNPLNDNAIKAILEMILRTWITFKKPTEKEHEGTSINKRFKKAMALDDEFMRKWGVLSIEREAVIDDPDSDTEGHIDFLITPGGRKNIFFGIEAKKICMKGAPKFSLYTGEGGMQCFTSGKYLGNLNEGGMIGYVMNGDLDLALKGVRKSMQKKAKELYLDTSSAPHGLVDSSLLTGRKEVKESKHNIPKRDQFKSHHIFLVVRTANQ